MKYSPSVIGIVLLSIVLTSPAYAFTDISSNNPDASAIDFLQTQGIVNGSEDGLFHPELSLTRCELTKIALKVADITPIPSSSSSFSDLPTSHWCHEYAYTARSHGILNGYPDGTFHPNQPVTEIEALKIIINSLQVTLPSVTEDLYLDVHATDWWAPYIKYARDNHLVDMPGSGNYGINNSFHRNRMAQAVYHGLDNKHPRVSGNAPSMLPANNPHSSANASLISPTSPANTVDSIITDLSQTNSDLNALNNLDLSALNP